jgi:hypothetical protein
MPHGLDPQGTEQLPSVLILAATTVAPSAGLNSLAYSSTIWFDCFSERHMDPGGGSAVYACAGKGGIAIRHLYILSFSVWVEDMRPPPGRFHKCHRSGENV